MAHKRSTLKKSKYVRHSPLVDILVTDKNLDSFKVRNIYTFIHLSSLKYWKYCKYGRAVRSMRLQFPSGKVQVVDPFVHKDNLQKLFGTEKPLPIHKLHWDYEWGEQERHEEKNNKGGKDQETPVTEASKSEEIPEPEGWYRECAAPDDPHAPSDGKIHIRDCADICLGDTSKGASASNDALVGKEHNSSLSGLFSPTNENKDALFSVFPEEPTPALVAGQKSTMPSSGVTISLENLILQKSAGRYSEFFHPIATPPTMHFARVPTMTDEIMEKEWKEKRPALSSDYKERRRKAFRMIKKFK